MLIAQITDLHIGFDRDNPREHNQQRLDAVLDRLQNGPNRPAAILATGDLTESGDAGSYARLEATFAARGIEVWPCVGNHDDRAAFNDAFPGFVDADGFVQYVRDVDGGAIGIVRLIVIDTLQPGRHGGAFCDVRAAWLTETLAERPDLPTYIVMHHPPIDSGIPWMTTDQREPWVRRFMAATEDAPHLMGLICGHLHRSVSVQWNDLTVAICASTAPQLALDTRAIDPEVPDHRPMIIADAPAYALHYWNGAQLVSHFDTANDAVVLASYDAKLQRLVRETKAERPQG
jgi:3',5'-cyclic-AMP phosphodiesterase